MHNLKSFGSANNTQGICFNLGERNNLNENLKCGLYRTICVCMPDICCVFLNEKHICIHYIIQFLEIPDTYFWPLQSYIASLDPASILHITITNYLGKE